MVVFSQFLYLSKCCVRVYALHTMHIYYPCHLFEVYVYWKGRDWTGCILVYVIFPIDCAIMSSSIVEYNNNNNGILYNNNII